MKQSRFLKIGILAAAVALTAVSARAEDDVRLRLNWMYYGSHAGFALGKDRGYYDEAGIDLDIRSGNGSSSAHRLVANGDSDFAYGSCGALVSLISVTDLMFQAKQINGSTYLSAQAFGTALIIYYALARFLVTPFMRWMERVMARRLGRA